MVRRRSSPAVLLQAPRGRVVSANLVMHGPPILTNGFKNVQAFLIEGGLYSETALREAKSRNTVYSRHQVLKQASHLTKNTYAWSRYHA